MPGSEEYLALTDEALLGQCDVQVYRSSGPGGQHRDKVSSAVRLRHRPTGVTAQGQDTRRQGDNKRLALKRLRMNLALRLRGTFDPVECEIPPVVGECLFAPRGRRAGAAKRLEVGRKDDRFWAVAGFLLDLLEGFSGRLGEAAAWLDVSTANLVAVFKSERHLLAAAQAIRKAHGHRPIS